MRAAAVGVTLAAAAARSWAGDAGQLFFRGAEADRLEPLEMRWASGQLVTPDACPLIELRPSLTDRTASGAFVIEETPAGGLGCAVRLDGASRAIEVFFCLLPHHLFIHLEEGHAYRVRFDYTTTSDVAPIGCLKLTTTPDRRFFAAHFNLVTNIAANVSQGGQRKLHLVPSLNEWAIAELEVRGTDKSGAMAISWMSEYVPQARGIAYFRNVEIHRLDEGEPPLAAMGR